MWFLCTPKARGFVMCRAKSEFRPKTKKNDPNFELKVRFMWFPLACGVHKHHMNLTLSATSFIFTLDMRWLRLVGSLELYVSFAEYSLFYRDLLPNFELKVRFMWFLCTPKARGFVMCRAKSEFRPKTKKNGNKQKGNQCRSCVCTWMRPILKNKNSLEKL